MNTLHAIGEILGFLAVEQSDPVSATLTHHQVTFHTTFKKGRTQYRLETTFDLDEITSPSDVASDITLTWEKERSQ